MHAFELSISQPACYVILCWFVNIMTMSAQKITVYQEASINYSNIRVTEPFPYPIGQREDVENKANIGFEAGFIFKINSKWEHFSFPIGLHYQQKGFHIKPEGAVYGMGDNGQLFVYKTDKIGYRFNYLTITSTAEFAIIEDKFGLIFGPYTGLRLKEAVKIYDHTGWEDDKGDTFVNKLDFGLQTGLRFYFGRFGLFAKYQFGLTKNDKFVVTDELFYPTGFLHFRNQAAVLGLSFRLTNN